MASFNNWNIITLPSPWSFTTQEWKPGRKTGTNISPFTNQVGQVFEWVGADSWTVTCTLPPMNADDVRAWRAFFWQAVGGVNAFMLGDSLRRKPKGVYFGSTKRSTVRSPITVIGTNNAMQTSFNAGGAYPNQTCVLSAGDLISVNYRLYEVTQDVNANAQGNMTISIMPSLRETLTDGMVVQTTDAQGLFRIPAQQITINVNADHTTTISFTATEAR